MGEANKISSRRARMVLAAALMAGIVATGQDVRYNFVPGTDFAKYLNKAIQKLLKSYPPG